MALVVVAVGVVVLLAVALALGYQRVKAFRKLLDD